MGKRNSKDVALVLSSGGARGLAHIGVIEELLSRDYRITSIAGCSMGAFVGGLHAVGNLEKYKEWILNLDKIDILRMIDFTLSSRGFIKGEKIFDRMRKLRMIPEIDIEDLPIPFAAVAADIVHNREKVFRSGNLPHAIRASIGIPSVFTPVPCESGLLVDGGVLEPMPLRHAARKEGDILVAVDLTALIPYRKPRLANGSASPRPHSDKIAALIKKWDEFFGTREHGGTPAAGGGKTGSVGYFDLVMRSIQLMQSRLTAHALEETPPDLLVRISKESATVFEFYKAEELIAYGREACASALDLLEK